MCGFSLTTLALKPTTFLDAVFTHSDQAFFNSITSKNSSMYEVGQDFADYILKNTQEELISMVSFYLQNPKAYKKKKEYIKNHYKTPSWDDFYKQLQTNLINKSKT